MKITDTWKWNVAKIQSRPTGLSTCTPLRAPDFGEVRCVYQFRHSRVIQDRSFYHYKHPNGINTALLAADVNLGADTQN